jgi:hypothetical protein
MRCAAAFPRTLPMMSPGAMPLVCDTPASTASAGSAILHSYACRLLTDTLLLRKSRR